MSWHFWWVDSVRVRPRGSFYRYTVSGYNDANGQTFFWTIPQLSLRPGSTGGGRYVFRLRCWCHQCGARWEQSC